MPTILLQSTSPYGTRRASLLLGDHDAYLYLEDLVSSTTVSTVWVANTGPAAAPGGPVTTPPRMAVSGTLWPEGCPPLGEEAELVWFEEGDAVALVDRSGVIAAIPGWAGRNDFYGFSRYAVGTSALAWELGAEALSVLESKVVESRAFWAWRMDDAWSAVRTEGLGHLEQRIGPQEVLWPLAGGSFPEVVVSRHRVADRPVWVTATTGMSAQRMAAVEQYVDEPEKVARIELAIARSTPDQAGAELLGALATLPSRRCTWLGEGHTIGGSVGAYPAFGPEKTAVLLTANPPSSLGLELPDLTGLVRRNDPVTYLWVLVIDQATFSLARGQGAEAALADAARGGVTWVQ